MADTQDLPQLYLITPPQVDLDLFPPLLAACLDAVPVACLRLSLSSRDEDHIARVADALRQMAHDRDIALVIDSHARLVERLGLDGVHVGDGARSIRALRKELGEDAIIGCYCGNSRHDGLSAAELGADYVSFGPVGTTTLDDGRQAGMDLFAWWSDVIEVPVVAEGALDTDLIRALAPMTDFVALGPEVWQAPDPVAALRHLAAALTG